MPQKAPDLPEGWTALIEAEKAKKAAKPGRGRKRVSKVVEDETEVNASPSKE